MKARGDKSRKVSSVKRSKGPADSKKSQAKGMRGKPVVWPGGQSGYQNR